MWYLTGALKKLPNFNGRVYRGSNNVLKAAEYKLGREVTWSAFSSTSAAERVALQFAGPTGLIFVMDVSCGKDISAFSALPSEQEVLLPPNAVLVVSKNSICPSGLSKVRLVEKTGSFKW